MLRRTLFAAALLGVWAGAAQAQTPTAPPPDQPGRDGRAHRERPDPFGDASVSRAEAQAKAEAQFAELDKNHDGFLSDEEFSDMFPADSRMHMMAPMIMTRADENGDGKLSRDEFVGSALKRFDAMDANHDGVLTKAERDAGREAMRGRRHGGGGPGREGPPGGDGPPPPGDDGSQ